MTMRSPNWFYTSTRFLAGAAWKDRGAGLLLWPAAWIEPNMEPSLGVRVHRITLGWLQWRCQCDLGNWQPIEMEGPIDWKGLGIDDYLAWSKKTFQRNWSRADVERLFRKEPAWRRLALLGSARNHYVRVVLARAMLSAQETTVSPAGVSEAVPVVDGKPTSTSQKAWTGSTASEASQSLMEGLEQLGANLRRNNDTET